MSLVNSIVARAFGAVASAPSLISNPRIAIVGDSLTQYSNATVNLNGVTLSRDSAGVVTVPKSGHGIFGSQPISIVNLANTSFESLTNSTYIDANNFSYSTGVTGTPTTTIGGGVSAVAIQNRYARIGYWAWLQGLFFGGLRFVANYGQGGDQLSDMGTVVSLAASSSADIVIMSGGINDINGYGQTAATVISRMQGHVNTLIAAGKKVVILGITPIGAALNNATKGQAIVDTNLGFASIASSNPNNIKFANAHSDLTDGTNNWQAYSWATTDSVHWGMRSASIVASRIATAITSLSTTSSLLPTGASDFPSFDGFTCIKQYGSWTGAGGGFAGTGSTVGTGANANVAQRLQIFSSNAATTFTPSIVSRGSLGYWQQIVVNAGGVNHDVTIYLQANSGETLASLGVSTGDELMMVAEIEISNANASNFVSLNSYVQSQSAGSFGIGSDTSGASSVATNPDSFSTILVTGRIKVTSSWTSVLQAIAPRFSAATANSCTIKIGRIMLYRKPA